MNRPPTPLKALSLRQPWASFMIRGIKTIENRSWRTRERGLVLVHASSWWRRDEAQDDYDDACTIAAAAGMGPPRFDLDAAKSERGGIVGAFTIVDCVDRSDDPFFFGRWGFVVRDAVRFPTVIPCRGALGFFDPPADVVEAALTVLPEGPSHG